MVPLGGGGDFDQRRGLLLRDDFDMPLLLDSLIGRLDQKDLDDLSETDGLDGIDEDQQQIEQQDEIEQEDEIEENRSAEEDNFENGIYQ